MAKVTEGHKSLSEVFHDRWVLRHLAKFDPNKMPKHDINSYRPGKTHYEKTNGTIDRYLRNKAAKAEAQRKRQGKTR